MDNLAEVEIHYIGCHKERIWGQASRAVMVCPANRVSRLGLRSLTYRCYTPFKHTQLSYHIVDPPMLNSPRL